MIIVIPRATIKIYIAKETGIKTILEKQKKASKKLKKKLRHKMYTKQIEHKISLISNSQYKQAKYVNKNQIMQIICKKHIELYMSTIIML